MQLHSLGGKAYKQAFTKKFGPSLLLLICWGFNIAKLWGIFLQETNTVICEAKEKQYNLSQCSGDDMGCPVICLANVANT